MSRKINGFISNNVPLVPFAKKERLDAAAILGKCLSLSYEKLLSVPPFDIYFTYAFVLNLTNPAPYLIKFVNFAIVT